MPNQPKTMGRPIRIDQELWDAALARAEAEGTTVSDKVRACLREWVNASPASGPNT